MALPQVNVNRTTTATAGQGGDGAPVVIGPARGGTINQYYVFGNRQQIIKTLVDGPACQVAAKIFDATQAPVHVVISSGTISPVSSSVAASAGAGPLDYWPTSGNETNFDYNVTVQCTKAGGWGVGEVRWSLDSDLNNNPTTWSASRIIPSADGTINVSDANMTLLFEDTSHSIGDQWQFSTTGSAANVSDFNAANAIVSQTGYRFTDLIVASNYVTSSNTKLVAAAMDTAIEAHRAQGRPVNSGLIAMTGDWSAAGMGQAASEIFSSEAVPVTIVAGKGQVVASHTYEAFSAPVVPLLYDYVTAIEGTTTAASENPARRARGPRPNVIALDYDERKSGQLLSTEALKCVTYSTTKQGNAIYITQAWLKTPVSSPYKYYQDSAVVRLGEIAAHDILDTFVNSSFGTNANGTLTEFEATRIDNTVKAVLDNVLLQPFNENNSKGLVSSYQFAVDRTFDISNGTIQAYLNIQPRANASTIELTLNVSRTVQE